MTDQRKPDESAALRAAVKALRPEPPPGSCPDPAYLAALLDRSLLPAERERIEAHVALCRTCLGTVTALAGASEAGTPPTRMPEERRVPIRGRRIGLLRSVAAGILVIVAVTIWQPWRDRRDTDTRLVAAAEDLARSHPDVLQGFHPLSREERLARGPSVRGSPGAPISPRGNVIGTRPGFRFRGSPEARGYELRILSAAGEPVLKTTLGAPATESIVEAPFPVDAKDLAAGSSYVWTIGRAGGPIEAAEATAFAIASPTDQASFEQAQQTIKAKAPAEIEGLLRAHHAIRAQYFAEAEKLARAYAAEHPADVAGHETLVRVENVLGLP